MLCITKKRLQYVLYSYLTVYATVNTTTYNVMPIRPNIRLLSTPRKSAATSTTTQIPTTTTSSTSLVTFHHRVIVRFRHFVRASGRCSILLVLVAGSTLLVLHTPHPRSVVGSTLLVLVAGSIFPPRLASCAARQVGTRR